jgi:hypothetical protein
MKSVLFIFLAFIMLACNNASTATKANLVETAENMQQQNFALLATAKQLIKEGDLIVRGGKDFSSRFVKEINKLDKNYSHGGIAVVKNGEIYIYHIIPDHSKQNDRVRLEKLDSFCTQFDNTDFAIARFAIDSTEIKTFIGYLNAQYNNKVPFDMVFDIADDRALYCSEMIAKGLALSTKKRIVIPLDTLNDKSKYKLIRMYYKVPEERFANMLVIPIDHLFMNKHCTIIKRFSYLQQP